MPMPLHCTVAPFWFGHGFDALHVCVHAEKPALLNSLHMPDMQLPVVPVHRSYSAPVQTFEVGASMAGESAVCESLTELGASWRS